MAEHKFGIGEYIAIIGGQFYGENGKIVEKLFAGTRPCYAVKITTGAYREVPGSTVIFENDLRAE